MSRFSQKHYSFSGGPGAGGGPGGLLGRVIAFLVAAGFLVVSFFLGAVFIALAVGFALIVGIAVALRMWWIRRKMEQYQREHGDLEGEYSVVVEERRVTNKRTD